MRDCGSRKQSEGFRGEDGGGVSPGPGIEEDTCCNEHWGFYANHESLNAASKTNDGLYGD